MLINIEKWIKWVRCMWGKYRTENIIHVYSGMVVEIYIYILYTGGILKPLRYIYIYVRCTRLCAHYIRHIVGHFTKRTLLDVPRKLYWLYHMLRCPYLIASNFQIYVIPQPLIFIAIAFWLEKLYYFRVWKKNSF